MTDGKTGSPSPTFSSRVVIALAFDSSASCRAGAGVEDAARGVVMISGSGSSMRFTVGPLLWTARDMEVISGLCRGAACLFLLWSVLLEARSGVAQLPAKEAQALPALVGHRGLINHAPENTLAGFAACLDLRLGCEVDIHRSKDSQRVCIHDATLDRTTNGAGKVAAFALAELRRLDAGGWFDPAFRD